MYKPAVGNRMLLSSAAKSTAARKRTIRSHELTYNWLNSRDYHNTFDSRHNPGAFDTLQDSPKLRVSKSRLKIQNTEKSWEQRFLTHSKWRAHPGNDPPMEWGQNSVF